MDMMGSRTKLIVKNSPHYSFPASLKNVNVGDVDMDKFVKDVFKVLRTGDLKKVPDPTPYSWDSLCKSYIEYFKEVLGE